MTAGLSFRMFSQGKVTRDDIATADLKVDRSRLELLMTPTTPTTSSTTSTRSTTSTTSTGRTDPTSAALANLDVSDPDSLLAFFKAQMTNAQSNVSQMMQDQQTRNDKVTALQSASAKFTQFEQSGIQPNSPNWNDFVAAANELKSLLPPGSAADTVNGILANAITGKEVVNHYGTEAEAKNDTDANPGATTEKVAVGVGLFGDTAYDYVVRATEGATGVTGDQVKSITSSVKSVTDGLQTDASMAMIRIQQGVERMSQITTLCSNVLKKQDDAKDGVIGNLR